MSVTGHTIRHHFMALWVPWLLALTFAQQAIAGPAADTEYKLKAALMYKLTKFVEWPSPRQGDNRQFTICVLGDDPFGATLDNLNHRKVHGRPIRIQRFAQSKALSEDCRLIFISASKKAFLESILRPLAHQPILTVGDMKSFAKRGGIIQMASNNNIVFKINVAADSAGLKIAAPLLDLATVTGRKDVKP